MTIIVVLKPVPDVNGALFRGDDFRWHMAMGPTTASNYQVTMGTKRISSQNVLIAQSPTTTQSPAMAVLRHDFSGTNPDTVAFRLNGSTYATPSQGDSGGSPDAITEAYIGNAGFSGSQTKIAEIIFFDRPLTDEELGDLEAFLTNKYNL